MRDENRIDKCCDELAMLWKKHCPDWRLMQLICNLQRACGSDLFYMEEGRFIETLKQYFGENTEK